MNPPQLTEAEAEAMELFFRHVWLGYDETRKPIRDLLRKVDQFLASRDERAR